ncbi:YfgJ family double zinc ribbon protein [Clostridium sp. DL1XJH146]
MKEKYYCPNCFEELEEVSGCGSVSYFCNECKKLISRKIIIDENEMENINKNNGDVKK